MNQILKAIIRTPDRAARRVFHDVMSRRSVNRLTFNSMTLDPDDVAIASQLLSKRNQWLRDEMSCEFAEKFARYNGSRRAFAFQSARVSLSACIQALGLKPGDEVIVPAYTCVVVPNAFRYAGVKVVFADIELETYGLDYEEMKKKVTSKTRAVLVHHLYGLVSRDMERIIDFCKSIRLWVIEDAAQAAGAEFKGKKVGNFGDVGIVSAEQSKLFNTIQGGLAITSNPLIGDRLQKIWESASAMEESLIECLLHTVIYNYYTYKHPVRWLMSDVISAKHGSYVRNSTSPDECRGIRPADYGCKMSDAVAEVGINQLLKIERYNLQRRQTAEKWDKWCESKSLKKAVVIPNSIPVFLRYPVQVTAKQKEDLQPLELDLGFRPGVWFVSNLHPSNEKVPNCPNAALAVQTCINLPCLIF